MADRPSSPTPTPYVAHKIIPPNGEIPEDRFIMDDMEADQLSESLGMDAIYSVQKMGELLADGPDAEREFILFELQQLLDHCLQDTLRILIPVLCEHVATWNPELQLDAASRLHDVVALKLEPHLANTIMNASFGVIQNATEHSNTDHPLAAKFDELVGMWGGILVDTFPSMNWEQDVLDRVISDLDSHSREQAFALRRLAALALGALAQCLDADKVEKLILPRLMDLFSDQHVQVRGNVIESLAYVGAALPLKLTETEIWPQVERLLDPPEDDARIRASAMRTMSHILKEQREKGVSGQLFREFLPPVFSRMCLFARKWAAEDQRLLDEVTYLLLEVVSEVYGQFLYTLSISARRSFRKESYRAYAAMATCNGPLIRRNCAYNLPGVCCALGEKYAVELSGVCEYLARDTDEETRWILSAGIHKTAGLLVRKGDFERLFTAVCALLQDENPVVRMNSIENFHELLSAFAKVRPDVAFMRRLSPVFSNLGDLCEGEWRTQEKLSEQIEKSAHIIPSECLIKSVLPLLRRFIERGTPPVRVAAMRATTRAFRHIPGTDDRNSAIDRFWAKHTEGTYWMRLALLEGGDAALQVFSRKRFAELFAHRLMLLANDVVVNVRIRVAKLLPKLAPMCYGTPEYEAAVKRLKRDNDRDVLEAVGKNEELAASEIEKAKQNESEDNLKFQNEQEFYGLAPKVQKKARRLASIRSGRLLSKLGNNKEDSLRDLRFSIQTSPPENAGKRKSSARKASAEVTGKDSTGSSRPAMVSNKNSRTASSKNVTERSFSNLRMSGNKTKSSATNGSVGSHEQQFLARSKTWGGIIRKKLGRGHGEHQGDKSNATQQSDVFAQEEFPFKSSNKKISRRRSRKRSSRRLKDESVLFNEGSGAMNEHTPSPRAGAVPVVYSIEDDNTQEPISPILASGVQPSNTKSPHSDTKKTSDSESSPVDVAGEALRQQNSISAKTMSNPKKYVNPKGPSCKSDSPKTDDKPFNSRQNVRHKSPGVKAGAQQSSRRASGASAPVLAYSESERSGTQKIEESLYTASHKLSEHLAPRQNENEGESHDSGDALNNSFPGSKSITKNGFADISRVDLSGDQPSLVNRESPRQVSRGFRYSLPAGLRLQVNGSRSQSKDVALPMSSTVALSRKQAALEPLMASKEQLNVDSSIVRGAQNLSAISNPQELNNEGRPSFFPSAAPGLLVEGGVGFGPSSRTNVREANRRAGIDPVSSGPAPGNAHDAARRGWKASQNGMVVNRGIRDQEHGNFKQITSEEPLILEGSNGYISSPGKGAAVGDDGARRPELGGQAPWARRGGNEIRIPIHSSQDSSNSFSESFAVHGFSKSDHGVRRKPRRTFASTQSAQNVRNTSMIPQRIKAGASGLLRFFKRKRGNSRTEGR